MRVPYWELGLISSRGLERDSRGRLLPRTDDIVCGRKFCAGCGHWRHVCDFGYIRGRRLRGRCRACWRAQHREESLNYSEEQLERAREYQRFWHDAKRRAAGIPPRNFRNRRSIIDRPEYVMLDPAPLLAEMAHFYRAQLNNGHPDYSWEALAITAGVPARSLYRLRTGESRHVRVDLADRIAVAIGIPLSLIYPHDDQIEA